MGTRQMEEAVSFTKLAVTLTFDPSADDCERWIACIGFDYYGVGHTAEEALGNAMNREALGPDSVCNPDPAAWDFTPTPCDHNPEDGKDEHDGPDGYYYHGQWYNY